MGGSGKQKKLALHICLGVVHVGLYFILLFLLTSHTEPTFDAKNLTSAEVYFSYEPASTLPPESTLCKPANNCQDRSRLSLRCHVSDFPSTMFWFRHIGNLSASVSLYVPPTSSCSTTECFYHTRALSLPLGPWSAQLTRQTFSDSHDSASGLFTFSLIPRAGDGDVRDVKLYVTPTFDFVATYARKPCVTPSCPEWWHVGPFLGLFIIELISLMCLHAAEFLQMFDDNNCTWPHFIVFCSLIVMLFLGVFGVAMAIHNWNIQTQILLLGGLIALLIACTGIVVVCCQCFRVRRHGYNKIVNAQA